MVIFTIEYIARVYCAGAQGMASDGECKGDWITDLEGEEFTELSYRGPFGKLR